MAGRKANKELTLTEKVALLEEINEGVSQRTLAEKYGISRKQIYNLVRKKEEVLKAESCNAKKNRKRLKCTHVISSIDKVMWRWFQLARHANLPISGPILKEKAMQYADKLKLTGFKASNGWLQRFKNRHNICGGVLSGEAGAGVGTSVKEWISRIPDLTNGYSPRDIFSMDETGLVYRALPDKTLKSRGEDWQGGKRSEERLTVMLCCNQLGEFEKPFVIGRTQSPRSFKDVAHIPVTWKWNKKAWMTSSLFLDWLSTFNDRMRRANRNVLVILDNAPSHPRDSRFSNVKLLFLPTNMTSLLQPLDQGIIKTFKTIYRQALLCRVLCAIDSEKSADNLAKSVSVLDACNWIKHAVQGIKPSTVAQCFSLCGFNGMVDVTEGDEDDLPPLTELVRGFCLQDENVMNAEEFVNFDNNVPANEEIPGDWEEMIIKEVVSEEEEAEDDEDIETDAGPLQRITWVSCKEHMSAVMSYVVSQANMPQNIIQMASSLQWELEKHVIENIVLKAPVEPLL